MDTEIKVPFGTLHIENSANEEQPGVFISFEPSSGDWIDLCGVEYHKKDDGNENESLHLYVWSDPTSDSWQKKYIFDKKDLVTPNNVYEVTISRSGVVFVEAENKQDAMYIADHILTDSVSWSDDWIPTDITLSPYTADDVDIITKLDCFE